MTRRCSNSEREIVFATPFQRVISPRTPVQISLELQLHEVFTWRPLPFRPTLDQLGISWMAKHLGLTEGTSFENPGPVNRDSSTP